MRPLLFAFIQSFLLAGGQVFLKYAQQRMVPFSWHSTFWKSVFLNVPFALCGLFFAAAALLWMYMVKHFPLSTIYPLVSLSYVFGMLAAVLLFHETVPVSRWIGVALIMIGCYYIAR